MEAIAQKGKNANEMIIRSMQGISLTKLKYRINEHIEQYTNNECL